MKILVFSDSHGNIQNMQKAVDMHPDADLLLHAGDGIKELAKLKNAPSDQVYVNGNFEDAFPSLRSPDRHTVIERGGIRILLCHGHKHYISYGSERLIFAALEENADIAVFGHTHVKYNAYMPPESFPGYRDNGLYLFNPGSISRPRDSIYPSFGIIDVRDNGILLSHGIIKP